MSKEQTKGNACKQISSLCAALQFTVAQLSPSVIKLSQKQSQSLFCRPLRAPILPCLYSLNSNSRMRARRLLTPLIHVHLALVHFPHLKLSGLLSTLPILLIQLKGLWVVLLFILFVMPNTL